VLTNKQIDKQTSLKTSISLHHTTVITIWRPLQVDRGCIRRFKCCSFQILRVCDAVNTEQQCFKLALEQRS